MDKLKMHTKDFSSIYSERLAHMFPECVTEKMGADGVIQAAIDFNILKQLLSSDVVEGSTERYQICWPDKRQAILRANQATNMTLRPCREESVRFDSTSNLYIEGDNLEVLKVLRETYLGMVQMIYIDPPYNTGKDSFVYNDNYFQDPASFVLSDEAFDDSGKLKYDIHVSSETDGRFHTQWLNMIYPRIKVSRDLLSEEGVLFVSIDGHELANMKRIGEEVFGAYNCLGVIANINNPKGRSDDKFIATAHEYIIAFAKDREKTFWRGFEPTEIIEKRYNKKDSEGRAYREIDLRKTGEKDLREDRPNLFYYFYYNQNSGDLYPDRNEITPDGYIQIKPLREDGAEGRWRWGIETAKENIKSLIPKFMPSRKIWGVMEKDYLEGRDLVKPTSAWTFKDVNSERGTEEFIDLGFDKRVFLKPKPVGTIRRLIKLATDNDSLILDFFSGSATTAQAVFEENLMTGGRRRFIMVQIPEPISEKEYAFQCGYHNICEIGKERIRRAGKKILEEQAQSESDGGLFAQTESKPKLDVGFRVLKLDSSNMQDVYYRPEESKETTLFEDNIKPDRTPEDLLFQVMLECNLPLSAKIETKKFAGKEVFSVNNGYLIACFDTDVNEDVIKAVAKMKPYYFIMRDSSLSSDNVADNFDQIFQAYSKETIRRVL